MAFEMSMSNGYGFHNAFDGDVLFRAPSSSNGIHMGFVMAANEVHFPGSPWAARIDGTSYEQARGIAVSALDGSVYVTGYQDSNAVTVYDIAGNAAANLENIGLGAGFVVKYTADGNFAWASKIEGSSGRASVAVSALDRSIVVSGVLETNPSATYVVRYSDSGAFAWASRIEGSSGDYSSVAVSALDGSIVVAGTFDTISPLTVYDSDGVATKTIETMLRMYATVACGGYHTMAIDYEGALYAWGRNFYGQLGLGNTDDKNMPTIVPGTWTTVACGDSHTLAFDSSGVLYAWGRNLSGQLGLGDNTNRNTPTVVPGTPGTWTTVVCGWGHTMAIDSEGVLYAWGGNWSGQLGLGDNTNRNTPVVVPGTWTTVACGEDHTMAIDSVGALYAWGANWSGQLGIGNTDDQNTPTIIPGTWTTVACGFEHTMAIDSVGALYAWGGNWSGQLGLGDNIDRITPTVVPGTWTTVVCGDSRTLAFDSSGVLYAWGRNNGGQLGLGDNTNRNTPTVIPGTWTTVVCGGSHTMAIDSEGVLYAWGRNFYGQLGLGNNESVNTPTLAKPKIYLYYLIKYNKAGGFEWAFRAIENVKKDYGICVSVSDVDGSIVATGSYTSEFFTLYDSSSSDTVVATLKNAGQDAAFVVKYSGSGAFAWAARIDGSDYDVGSDIAVSALDGSVYVTGYYESNPVTVYDASGSVKTLDSKPRVLFDKVIVRRSSSFAFSEGALYAWGENARGQLGLGDNIHYRNTPTVVPGTWTTVACGGDHTMAFDSEGVLYAWGNNFWGELGLGDTINRNIPTIVPGTWTTVACGFAHTMAIDSSGVLYAWGANWSGQLGIGNNTNTITPTIVQGTWTTVACGNEYTMAIDSSGALYAWGRNDSGQLGLGDNTARNIPTIVLIPGTLSTIVCSIATYTMAIDVLGVLYAWGYNGFGQLGLGDTINRNIPTIVPGTWTTVACGFEHTLALDSEGALYAWGRNGVGQLGLEDNINRNTPTIVNTSSIVNRKIVAIAAGLYHSVAIDDSGVLYVWGNNGFGQLGIGTTSNINFSPMTLPIFRNFTALIVKYDIHGSLEWAARIDGTRSDYGRGIAVSPIDGSVYMTGHYESDPVIVYDESGNAVTTLANAGQDAAFVVKYAESGTFEWAARIDGTGSALGWGIAVCALNGSVHVTGTYYSDPIIVYDSAGMAVATLANAGSSATFVVKYNADGTLAASPSTSRFVYDLASALRVNRDAITVSSHLSLATTSAPSTNTPGELGQIIWDGHHLYVYVRDQTWKTAAFVSTLSNTPAASAAATSYAPATARRVGVLETATEDAHLFSNSVKDDLLLYGVHSDQAIVLGEKQNGTVDVAVRIGAASLELHRSLVLSASRYDPERRALGQTGEMAWDENYLYICVSSGVWKRATLT